MQIMSSPLRILGARLVLIGISVTYAGVACANRSQVGSSAAQSAPIVEPVQPSYQSVTISLERTACYGTCPVYSLTINQDGVVEYDGKMFVAVIGKRTRQIDPAAVRDLVALFYEVDFFSLQDRYDQMVGPSGVKMTVADLPTTTTAIAIDARRKRVENYVGGPQELRRLEQMIDQVAGAGEWVNPEAAKPQGALQPKP